MTLLALLAARRRPAHLTLAYSLLRVHDDQLECLATDLRIVRHRERAAA